MGRHAVHPIFGGRGALDRTREYRERTLEIDIVDDVRIAEENRIRYIRQSRDTLAGAPAPLPSLLEAMRKEQEPAP